MMFYIWFKIRSINVFKYVFKNWINIIHFLFKNVTFKTSLKIILCELLQKVGLNEFVVFASIFFKFGRDFKIH